MAPSSPSSSDRIGIEAGQTGAGSIREVSERLLLWAKRDGGSLAQVEYVSEFARQQVEQRLRNGLLAAGVAITSIELPTRRPATEIVEYLLAELAQVPSGVVLVTGFATAFESQVPLEDALRIVNFNREALIAFPLRQVWWMTPVVVLIVTGYSSIVTGYSSIVTGYSLIVTGYLSVVAGYSFVLARHPLVLATKLASTFAKLASALPKVAKIFPPTTTPKTHSKHIHPWLLMRAS